MRNSFERWADRIRSKHTFATVLIKQLTVEAFGERVLGAKTISSKYENMWIGYHHFSVSTSCIGMWSIALETPATESFFPLFLQLVTRRLMEAAIVLVFPDHGIQTDTEDIAALKADDEQAIRYVAGYVALMLRKKYSKHVNDAMAIQYVNILTQMHEVEEDNDEELPGFLEYTKLWIARVNRGGLFLVDDNTFLLFRAMETAVRQVFSTAKISRTSAVPLTKQAQTVVLNDPAVLVHWHDILSVCQPMESSDSDNLLEEMAEKWATIRAHSFAAGMVEQYQCTKQKSNREKSLRKGLQRKSSDSH